MPLLPNKEDGTEASSTDDVIIRSVPNAKPVGRFNSSSSLGNSQKERSSRQASVVKNQSLKLLTSPKRGFSSIGSGNLASESGSSYYHIPKDESQPLLGNTNVEQNSIRTVQESNVSLDEKDTISLASSVIPPLSTRNYETTEGILPVRSEINAYNPPVPPRSKDRPRSRLFIRGEDDEEFEDDTIESYKKNTAIDMNQPAGVYTSNIRDIQEPRLPYNTATSIASGVTNTNSESYYSAASYEDPEVEEQEASHSRASTNDEIYLSRALPNIPGPQRDETLKVPPSQEAPRTPKVKNNLKNVSALDKAQQYDDDDQYEDINDTVQSIENEDELPEIPTSRPHHNKDKKKSPKKKKQTKSGMASFDIDTLNQLLNVTKGTLIGSEFNNLGMKIEEKRALEKLVDSLSRLTADMVLDPDRFQEGLRRLEKATKALDGF